MSRNSHKIANPTNKNLITELKKVGSKIKGNSKHAYLNAAKAIQKHILPIKCAADAEILKGVGKFVLKKIEEILNTDPPHPPPSKKRKKVDEVMPKISQKSKTPKREGNESNRKRSVLLIDSREKEMDRNFFIAKMEKEIGANCCKTEQLALGDFLWVLEDKPNKTRFVCGVVIERKRVSDFEKSIKDSRYGEQKSRLRRCGLSKVIYLIEGNIEKSESKAAIYKAIASLESLEGFLVYFSKNLGETANFLSVVAKEVNQNLLKGDSRERFIKFEDFSKMSKCCFAESTVFARQLMCIDGIGREKAFAIAESFGSCRELLERVYGSKDKTSVISEIKYGSLRKKIGKGSAEKLLSFFS